MSGISLLDVTLVLLPSIVCYATQIVFGFPKKAGDVVKYRPPAGAFGVVWQLLFLALGLSFAISLRASSAWEVSVACYTSLILSLAIWIALYRYSRLYACWLLVVILMLLLMCFTTGNQASRLLLCPLISWIVFAIHLSTTELQLQ